MHFPLTLALRPAGGVLAPVLVAHVAAGLALFHAGAFPPPASAGVAGGWLAAGGAAGSLLIAWSLAEGFRGEFAKRGMVLVLREDGALAVEHRGRVEVFRVADGAVDFGWAAWLPLYRDVVPPGRVSRRLMLISANLPPGRWRAFRIWLRHKARRKAGD